MRTKTTKKMKRTAIIKLRWSQNTAACAAILVLAALTQPATAANKEKPKKEKPYALIFGTAYGPDDRPLYGVKITIHPEGKKHPAWQLFSDHRGEFAQRVPTVAADYLIIGEAEYTAAGKRGKPDKSQKKKLRGEPRVHMEGEIRQDIGLHLAE
jgi:hypothetical protein